jgi:hypothetical protein
MAGPMKAIYYSKRVIILSFNKAKDSQQSKKFEGDDYIEFSEF